MGFTEVYDFYWHQYVDPRTIDMPLMRSPVLIPLIIASYLYFVLKCGPEYMKNRKPYELKSFIQWYNVFQIVANGYLVQQLISIGLFSEVSVFCESSDFSRNPNAMKLCRIMWLTTMVKLIDLVETAVFVLRKKNNQISFLHLYHHVSTLLITWLMTRYIPVWTVSFPILVNCGIHVIMYTYYLMSTFGGNMQKLMAPFKPLITIAQMVQFIALIVYAVQVFLPYCHVSKTPSLVFMVDLVINFVLFYNFYQTAYVKSARKTN